MSDNTTEILAQETPEKSTSTELVKPQMAADYLMSGDEYWSTMRRLERYHIVFSKLLEMGRVVFSQRVPTAGVRFSNEGEFLEFCWNPEYYASLSNYERDFTNCHEALHVLFNHGVRSKGHDPKIANCAMDLVVNHTLINQFGFVREFTKQWWRYDWVDTVFPASMNVPTDESYEFYYHLLLENQDKVTIKVTVDDHGAMGGGGSPGEPSEQKGDDPGQGGGDQEEEPQDGEGEGEPEPGEGEGSLPGLDNQDMSDSVVETMSNMLTDEDKRKIDPLMDKHGDPSQTGQGAQPGGKQAGRGAAGIWKRIALPKPKPKPKWESIIKKRTRKMLKEVDIEEEQWILEPRRFVSLFEELPDIMLPFEMVDLSRAMIEEKVSIDLYIDASGSCWNMVDRFVKCANDIPPEKFFVSPYSFDDRIYAIDALKSGVAGGGGTRFQIMEANIQRRLLAYKQMVASGGIDKERVEKERLLKRYPDLVVVMTDGYACDRMQCEIPKNWVVILTSDGTKNCFLQAALMDFYSLKDFE